ncbi:hypothetical protein HI914_05199 [Erysiphe necator]|nr:hypothetical protein HI914_05199 [Erysiphe necator]
MHLRDRIKKKTTTDNKKFGNYSVSTPILVLRSDSTSAEVIHPPSSPVDDTSSHGKFWDNSSEKRTKRLLGKLRLESTISTDSSNVPNQSKPKVSAFRRLSKHLHRRKKRASKKVPTDLPDIEIITEQVERSVEKKINEIRSQWEMRAMLLAKKNEESQKNFSIPEGESDVNILPGNHTNEGDKKPISCMTTKNNNGDNIQEAIRLHEAGELQISTEMFGRLAESPGENNNLSQVLYGLSLRHGWGCTPDPVKALKYLSAAATSAASIEDSALKAGKKMGGLARGELVIAIYELANCFRNGWGLPVDEVAAKQARITISMESQII